MPLNILLVDDDPDFADVIAESLRADGHRTGVALDGASALTLARELRPDVVLLDLRLPDADGYELARTLRRELPETTAIIMVTGMREAGLVDDIDLMLNKPVPTDGFAGLVEYISRRRHDMVVARTSR